MHVTLWRLFTPTRRLSEFQFSDNFFGCVYDITFPDDYYTPARMLVGFYSFLCPVLGSGLVFRSKNPDCLQACGPFGQSCPCQKHPFTKITVLNLGKTISGDPGKSLRCSLNLRPLLCRVDLTYISGLVFLLLTEDIIDDLVSALNLSMFLSHVFKPGAGTSASNWVHLA